MKANEGKEGPSPSRLDLGLTTVLLVGVTAQLLGRAGMRCISLPSFARPRPKLDIAAIWPLWSSPPRICASSVGLCGGTPGLQRHNQQSSQVTNTIIAQFVGAVMAPRL
jgi:hypothetical protein